MPVTTWSKEAAAKLNARYSTAPPKEHPLVPVRQQRFVPSMQSESETRAADVGWPLLTQQLGDIVSVCVIKVMCTSAQMLTSTLISLDHGKLIFLIYCTQWYVQFLYPALPIS